MVRQLATTNCPPIILNFLLNAFLLLPPARAGVENTGFRSQGSNQQSAGGGDGGDDRNYSTQHSDLSDIHEHLALTVLRLQQTVKSISNRIENLEAKVNERPTVEHSKKEIKKQAWWSNRTTQTTVLLILWPFAAHLIISAIKKKVNK